MEASAGGLGPTLAPHPPHGGKPPLPLNVVNSRTSSTTSLPELQEQLDPARNRPLTLSVPCREDDLMQTSVRGTPPPSPSTRRTIVTTVAEDDRDDDDGGRSPAPFGVQLRGCAENLLEASSRPGGSSPAGMRAKPSARSPTQPMATSPLALSNESRWSSED